MHYDFIRLLLDWVIYHGAISLLNYIIFFHYIFKLLVVYSYVLRPEIQFGNMLIFLFLLQ